MAVLRAAAVVTMLALLALAPAAWADVPAAPSAPAIPPAAAQPSLAVPAAVRHAADVWQRSTRGVIAFERTVDFTLRAGPLKYTEHNDATLVLEDGAFVRIKVTSMTRDGHDLGDAAYRTYEAKTEKDWAAGKGFLHLPYDDRYLAEYSYSSATPAPDVPWGSALVGFSSQMHDAQHGSGTMAIDPAGHVLRLTYAPNVLPDHASSATTVQYSTEALPGVWLPTRVESSYSGRLMAFGGAATLSEAETHFRRFPTMVSAVAAIGADQ